MNDKQHRRQPAGDRARKRAVRAQAARTGVPYSVAARQLNAVRPASGEMLASQGRTVYPAGADAYRQWLIACRDRRSFDERVQAARRAAELPSGRAWHLAERFPPTRGEAGTGTGLLYHGERRQDALALLYLVVAHESPGLVPDVGDLAWIAELGEETALDIACGELDRMARLLLDEDRPGLWPRIESALAASATKHSWQAREEAVRLRDAYRAMMTTQHGSDGEPLVTGPPLDGVRNVLDAVLVVGDDGHAPGTRVRLLVPPEQHQTATIVAAVWGPAGPPIAYEVLRDRTAPAVVVDPDRLVVLAAGQPF
jgi:hypothetical protein